MEPSAWGFRNIQPKTRAERRGLKDKVALEKQRIGQRVGISARMHQANAPATSAELTSCPIDGAGYLANGDRFHSDTAGEAYDSRQHSLQRRNQIDDNKRHQRIVRDEERYITADEKTKVEEERWQKIRDDGAMAKKNQSNVAYDIFTLQYNQDMHGEQQKYADDMVRYRAELRKNALVVNGESRAGYNIIHGGDRPQLQAPSKINKPDSLVNGHISNKAAVRR